MRKINLAEKFNQFSTHWSPKIVAELNGQHVKLVKFAGEFVWHHHQSEDELFLVIEGEFEMQHRGPDGLIHSISLQPGEFLVVPRGTEHRPVAEKEVSVLLFEPAGTLNTGTANPGPLTIGSPEQI